MRRYKTVISLLLVVSTMLGLISTATATDNYNSDAGNTSTLIDLVDASAFNRVFSTSQSNEYSVTKNQNISIFYSYDFANDEEELDVAYVTLDFTLVVGTTEYPMRVQGEVSAYALESGDTLWEGPLDGNVEIGTTEYTVLAGFAKLDTEPNIQVSVTIQAAEDNGTLPAAFTFGDTVITQAMLQSIENATVEVAAPVAPIGSQVSTLSTGTFSQVGYQYTTFNSNVISGHAQAARAFLDQNNRLAVTICTFCGNVDTYYSSGGMSSTTSVHSFKNRLTRGTETASNGSHIAGIETYGFNQDNFGALATLKPLFEDAMALLGIPTATINAIFDSLKGTATDSQYTNDSYVSIVFGLNQYANFDNSDRGVPIVFQLAKSSSSYTGGSRYTFSTQVRYRTLRVSSTGTITYYYTDAYDTSKSITFDLH